MKPPNGLYISSRHVSGRTGIVSHRLHLAGRWELPSWITPAVLVVWYHGPEEVCL